MSSYKLVYFSVRGRAQALRYLCTDNDIPLEEQVVQHDKWATMKESTVFGQVPVLYDGTFQIAQSNAILRHIARKHGLYGKTDEDKTKIDMLNDQQEDVRLSYAILIYQQYDTEKDNYVKSLPDKLAPFEKFLVNNKGGNGFFVGDQVSFVDYNMFDLLDNLLLLSAHSLDTLPHLKAFHTRFAAREKLAKLRSTEAFKNLKVNGNGKQ